MGQICSSPTQAKEYIPQPIHISHDTFKEVSSQELQINLIKELSNNQISDELLNHKVYKKNNNTYFIGTIQENQVSRYGIIYHPEKNLYYGSLEDGLMTGKGTLIFIKNNSKYVGQFKQGKPHGDGIFQNQIFLFEGQWKENNNKKVVPVSGVLKFQSHKSIQEIKFDSFQHRNGTIKFVNGSKYQGFMQKNLLVPDGVGKMQYQTGDIYEGQWSNGRFQGSGTYSWRNGSKYTGQYLNGLKHGQGNYYFGNGKQYSGEWKNGLKDGFGKVINNKGQTIQKGIYKDDKFDIQLTKAYEQNSMQKMPKQELKSELLDQEKKEQIV